MASSPLPPPPSVAEEELEEELVEVGNKLLKPPSSTDELLNLLDEVGCLLSKVTQEPTHSMLDALKPSMKALIGSEILMHNDTNVKVYVASCISEMSRIMAPNAPYNDEEMKTFFQLSIVAIEQLSNMSGRSYLRAVLVLKTLANIRLCVLMLDLEMDDLVLKMFERFLSIKSQPDAIVSDMERIMTLTVEESEERSFELLTLLLNSVKRENQNASPQSWELGQKVLKNCAGILVSDIPKAVNSMGTAYNDYAEIVASICQVTMKTDNADTGKIVSDDIMVRRVEEDADAQPRSGMIGGGSDTLVNEISLADCQQRSVTSLSNSLPQDISKEVATPQPQKKRGRKPNSLRKEEEGYDNSWVIGISSSHKTPSRAKNPKKRTCNPSNSSALVRTASPPEPGKEPNSLAFSVKNVHGARPPSPPSRNRSTPENVHSRPQSEMHQKEKQSSSMNPDNGLNLLSVSAGILLTPGDEETPPRVPPEIYGSTGNGRGKRKKGSVNTASQSDVKAKRRRVVRKNDIERTGDTVEKHREGLIPAKTDGICSSQEMKTEFSEWQFDAVVQKLGSSAPIGLATEQPGDGFEFAGASTVKKRNCTSLPIEEDHGEEMVGRKIKVWWPDDDKFYRGIITGFDPKQKKHKVVYVDGDEEILYLRKEHWEIVEDEEDSEATEDTRPPMISSASRLPNAEADSSHPGNINEKTSVAHRKKRMSMSCEQGVLVRNNVKPDGTASGRRTKRRTLHDEQGKKSSANIQAIPGEQNINDQVVEASSVPVKVGGYSVKAANAPILASILAKYGDIAAHCAFTSAAVRASLLDVICDIVKRLQSNKTEDNISQLEAMETEVRAAETAKIEVSWLQQCLEKFRETNVAQSPSMLSEMKANLMLVVSKAVQRDLAAAQKWAKDAENCMSALAVVGKKFSDDMSMHKAKESKWRNPLDELAKL